MKKTISLLSLLLCGNVFAGGIGFAPTATKTGSLTWNVASASNGTPVAVGTSRTVTAGTAGEAVIRDMFKVSPAAEAIASMYATRTVSKSALADAAMGIAKSVPYVGAVLGIGGLFLEARMAYQNGNFRRDLGKEPESETNQVWCVQSICAGSPDSAASKWMATKTYITPVYVRTTLGIGGNTASVVYSVRTAQPPNGYMTDITIAPARYDDVSIKKCPDGSAVGPDAMCPTGNMTPITEAAARQAFDQALDNAASKPDYTSVLEKILDAVSQHNPSASDANAPVKVSSPLSELVGVPTTTTTTTPTGTTKTTTTPKWAIDIDGNKVVLTPVVDTNKKTTDTAGNVVDETNTTTKPGTKTSDTPALCELFPSITACVEFGESPEAEVPEARRDISVSAENIGLGEGCPADVSTPVGVLSMAPACEAASKMRPFVIAAGILSAMLICVAAIRSN